MASSEQTPDPLYPVSAASPIGVDSWLRTRLDHPEDVAVSDDGLLFAGGEDGQLYRIDPETNDVQELGRTGGFVLGVELGPEGDLYACDFQEHAVYRLPLDGGRPDGDPEPYIQGNLNTTPVHPNYVTFDRKGRLFVSDSGTREKLPGPFDDSGGSIFVEHPDGRQGILTDELSAFPNGLALSTDSDTLYVCETGTHAIHEVGLDSGTVTNIEPIMADCGMADGLALDAHERLYIASISDNAIYRVEHENIETVVQDETGLIVNNPTNVAFGGSDMRTMYIANLGVSHLTALEIDATGRHPTSRCSSIN